jgi:hypothetical protein
MRRCVWWVMGERYLLSEPILFLSFKDVVFHGFKEEAKVSGEMALFLF